MLCVSIRPKLQTLYALQWRKLGIRVHFKEDFLTVVQSEAALQGARRVAAQSRA